VGHSRGGPAGARPAAPAAAMRVHSADAGVAASGGSGDPVSPWRRATRVVTSIFTRIRCRFSGTAASDPQPSGAPAVATAAAGQGQAGAVEVDVEGTKKRAVFKDQSNDAGRVQSKVCAHCHTMETPLWRNGPMGPKTLCNACGVRHTREEGITNHQARMRAHGVCVTPCHLSGSGGGGGDGDGGDDVSRPTHTGFGFEGGDDTSSLKRRRVTTSGGGGDSSFRSTTPALMRTAPRLRGVAANEIMTPGGNSGSEPGRRPVCNSVNAPGSAVAPFSLESVDTPRAKRRTSPYMRYCAAQRTELLAGDPALTFGQVTYT